jgi:endo-alpha-1,4-polygalactosaminidase (GH114 family)
MKNISAFSFQTMIIVTSLVLTASGGAIGSSNADKNSSKGSENYSLPAKNDANFVFAIIGDFGDTIVLADEPDTIQVANLIKSWDPAFIATVGDNDYTDGVHAAGVGADRFTGLELGVGQFFHEFIGNYQGSAGSGAATNQFFPIPGDHDYGDDCDNPRLDPYLDYFTLPNGPVDETYYDLRRENVHLFMIDSIEDCHQDDGAKIAAQETWLKNTALASDADFKVVLIHHPPYSSGASHGSAEHVQWDYSSMDIDLVIAGDDHIYERIKRDEITYLVNGLGGVEIHPDFDTPVAGSVVRYNDKFGAVRLDVYDNRLLVSFVSVDGEVQDQFSIGSGSWYRPIVSDTWQWQLQGTLNTNYDVDVYDIDLFDTKASTISALQAANRKVICYFSAGSYEEFRDDASQFNAADLGNNLNGFSDEKWLDIRSTNVRRIMQTRLDVAVSKGCDGVEPDNMDGYDKSNNAGFDSDPLSAADQLNFNRFIANEAHARGLSVGLKNDLQQIPDLVDYYDFAVNEQCHQYNECEKLQPFVHAGKPVFSAEYPAEKGLSTAERDQVCQNALAANIRTLILPLGLDDTSRFSCDN